MQNGLRLQNPAKRKRECSEKCSGGSEENSRRVRNMEKLTVKDFGTTEKGQKALLYTMKNDAEHRCRSVITERLSSVCS